MSEKKVFVKLKATDGSKDKENIQSFEITVANKLLKLSNSKWKLEDKGFKWNGIEIAKA